MEKFKITIGSRGSDLALWQAHHVKDRLIGLGADVEIKIFKTQGDKIQHLSLDKLEGKGFFTKELEDALLNNEIDLGLIIHENRFTYQDKGLVKILDLGEFWEEKYNSAIPLGGIVVNRKFDNDTQLKIDRVLRRSVEFAFANPKSSFSFVREHSQEMSEEVMYKHIDLYVNKYSVNLGSEGRKAIYTLFDTAVKLNIIPSYETDFILEEQN